MNDAATYWESRAIEFGEVAGGLPAVCSYGMPKLYNQAIHACQSHALAPWLTARRGLDVLDVGCGVGRWSLRLAEQGNRVVGLDISPRMIELAKRGADARQINCDFLVHDLVSFDLSRKFDLIFGVTVLQHVVDDRDLHQAIANLAAHLAPQGSIVLLEVAPSNRNCRCESAIFRTRTLADYTDMLASAGLEVTSVEGVDVAPFRRFLVPVMRALPPSLARGLITGSSILSLPFDLALSRHLPRVSWHQVIVARHKKE